MKELHYAFGETDKLKARERQLNEFIERMFDEDERPYFIADEACLYDIYIGDDNEFCQRCQRWYGCKLSREDFLIPIWQLLDQLYLHSQSDC